MQEERVEIENEEVADDDANDYYFENSYYFKESSHEEYEDEATEDFDSGNAHQCGIQTMKTHV